MSEWRDITSSPDNPFKTKMRVSSNGLVDLEYTQTNMNEVLEVNTALQNEEKRSSALWGGRDHVHVARIPEEVIHQWHREGINIYRWNEEDRARAMSKLNDPSFSKFRTDGNARL